ncbi:amidase [Novosphingobium sp. NDB2Meth1]|uniref:amidase n=1 Tax=Novosphingobium sp. NDB2Meth1 TaxID=1892847 RepID=UPI00092FF5DD|nr:amidase family protein [Novosphingobium sp. NDB2Meth1]
MNEGEAIIAGLVGRWDEPADPPLVTEPGNDPFGAVVCAFDLPPTGTGPLTGKTLSVKDNIAVGGVPTALGTGQAGFIPAADAAVVARARRAGARIIAKAQCEAFLLGANSFSSRPRPVRNPHDVTRSAGGSSSGSAAMVAGGLADLALGTDSGGSIRVPAAYCGLVGFKPSRGRVSYTGIAPLEPFLEHAGPIARNVTDAAALFAALDGPDPTDIRTAWRREIAAPAQAPQQPLRLGILTGAQEMADAAIGKVMDTALDHLADGGAELVTVDWPALREASELHLVLYGIGQALIAETAGAVPGLSASLPSGWVQWRRAIAEIPHVLHEAIALGQGLAAADPELYARGVRRALALGDALDAVLAGVDGLVLPTARSVAPPIPKGAPTAEEIYGDTAFTAPFNLTGSPALSLPAGTSGGLPVGLQLVGRRGDDAALLAAALRVEAILSSSCQEPLP